jgi:hypothetical protein
MGDSSGQAELRAYLDSILGQLNPGQINALTQWAGGDTFATGTDQTGKYILGGYGDAASTIANQLGIKPGSQEWNTLMAAVHYMHDPHADPAQADALFAQLKSMKYPGAQPAGPQVDPNAAANDRVNSQIQSYIDGLSGDPAKDPVYNSLVQTGAAEGASNARNNGIQGGYGSLMGQQGAYASAMPYLQQREQLRGQALNLLNSADLGQRQAGLNALQVANDVTKSNYGLAQNRAGAGGALVGGILDGVLGAYGINDGGAGSKGFAGLAGAAVPGGQLAYPTGYSGGAGGGQSYPGGYAPPQGGYSNPVPPAGSANGGGGRAMNTGRPSGGLSGLGRAGSGPAPY